MSARYWVKMSGELIARIDPSRLASAGLRIVSLADPVDEGPYRWVMLRDESAPAELEGERVEIAMAVDWSPAYPDGRARITSRQVVG